ncbi:MAG: glycosyltransferase [Flavobacteriales bacterium]|nr:glycosyltransferase [Flavobacteriales bacterium]
MTTPLALAFVLFAAALLQAVLLSAWRDRLRKERGRKHMPSGESPAVTMIVPARDAERTLIPLLQDLNAQDLPKEQVQVIVVDDHSTDGTAHIVESMIPRWPQLQLVRNDGEGKKAAITRGVEAAKHDVIILTDADARCGRERARLIADAMERDRLDLLILPARTMGGGGFVGRLQEEEQAGLLGMAMGEVLLGRPGLAYGANIAFRRSAFSAVGGYGGDRFASGDDLFLVQRMKKAGKRIGGLLDVDALVTVEAEPTWRGFVRQRLRWAGKMRGVRSAMPWAGLLLLPWALLWVSLRFSAGQLMEEHGVETLLLLVFAWLLWVVPVTALVLEVRRFLGQRRSALVTAWCYALFTVYSPVIALVSLFYRPQWKGRRV